MQKPAFQVVPASQSSKLACKCGTCKPLAGFPPVCTGCKCEEAVDDAGEPKEDVFMIGHTKACAEDKVCVLCVCVCVRVCTRVCVYLCVRTCSWKRAGARHTILNVYMNKTTENCHDRTHRKTIMYLYVR